MGTPADAAGQGGAPAPAEWAAASGAAEELRAARLRLRPYRRTDFETLFRELVVLEKCGFAFERPYTGSDGHPYRRYVRRSAG